jgi:predicted MFS family arabinose efflux permease
MLAQLYQNWLNSFRGLGKDVWLLSFVNFINRTGSMVVVFLTLYLTQKKGFSIDVAGYILVFNGIGAVIGTYLGGWLTDKFGYYKLQIFALHLQGIILMMLAYADSFYGLAAIVMILSIASEANRPANQVAFIAHTSPALRTRAVSLNRMGINLAFTVAPAIGGLLLKWSWLALFWVDAITCILAAWLMIFFLKEKSVDPEKTTEGNETLKTISAYRDTDFLKFIGFTFLNAVVFMQLIWTIPNYFHEVYHWEMDYLGLVLAANGLFVAVVEMPLIFRIEKKYPILGLVRTGLICYGLSYLALSLGLPNAWAAAAFIILISFGEIYVMPFSFSYVSKLAPPARSGQYMALYSIAYAFSQIFAPLLGTQLIYHFGYNTLWVVLSILAGISFLGLKWIENNVPTPKISSVL